MKGENKSLRLALENWIQQHEITKYDFLSIVFTPAFTLDDILRGKRSLAALFRIYLLTNLIEFKLSNEELKAYEEVNKKKQITIDDEKITRHFIERWKAEKAIPAGDERLVWAERNNPDKDKVRTILLKRYFKGAKSQNAIKAGGENKKSIVVKPVGASVISQAADELEHVLNLKKEDIADYRKGKASGLKRLKVLVDFFVKENPKEAYEAMINSGNSIFNL
jgi:hypothetical protein